MTCTFGYKPPKHKPQISEDIPTRVVVHGAFHPLFQAVQTIFDHEIAQLKALSKKNPTKAR